MTEHPLTDETCRAIDDKASTKTNNWKDCMRAGADWQLEQVIQAWDQSMEESRSGIHGDSVLVPRSNLERFIHRFDQKLKAMRPTNTQEKI